MDRERFARLERLFNAAAALPETGRRDYLMAQEPDAQIVAEVERLLARHADTRSFLGDALSAAAAVRPAPMQRIDDYEVIGELGEGGMGTVLLAERMLGDTPQRVALKLIRGMPTASARERLARERALLAELNHPGIARLFDAGETADAVPYLAMEHVEGEPLLAYCDTHALDLRARLRLFVQICRAVQHAHQHLIVHRDIKPANILVRSDGTPVLLDFGIGKLIEPGTEDQTATQAFTPAYAAPEQRAGERVTTAADVWGLGGVLFELVSGSAMRVARSGDRVPRASSVATANARELRGDLDAIVATALQVAPTDRYASAQALAEDVERYLEGKPVQAQPDRVGYRLRKFAVRHAYAVAASVAAGVLIMGLLFWLFVARNEAIRHAHRAEVTRDFLVSLFRFADPNVHQGAPVTVRDMLDEGSKRLDAELLQQPDLHAELSEALGVIYRDIGDDESALAHLRTAAQLTAPNEDPLVRARRLAWMARAVLKQARSENGTEALKGLDEALALLGDREDDPALLLRLQILASRSLALAVVDRGDDAVRTLQGAMNLVPKLHAGQDAQRGNLLYDLTKLHAMTGDSAAARTSISAAEQAYAAAYGSEHPETIKAMEMHATLLGSFGETAAAEDKYRAIISAQRKVFPADNPHIRHVQVALADLLIIDRHLDEALALYESLRQGCIAADTSGYAPGIPCYRVIRGVGIVHALSGQRGGVDEVRSALEQCRPADSYTCTTTMIGFALAQCSVGERAAGQALLPKIGARLQRVSVNNRLDHLRIGQMLGACGSKPADLQSSAEWSGEGS